MRESTRVVYAAFTHNSGLPNRRLTINRRGSVFAQVEAQIPFNEQKSLIGVLNADQTAWID